MKICSFCGYPSTDPRQAELSGRRIYICQRPECFRIYLNALERSNLSFSANQALSRPPFCETRAK